MIGSRSICKGEMCSLHQASFKINVIVKSLSISQDAGKLK